MFGLSELAVILIVVILVLAAKKLPDLARSAGKSARILKAEVKAMKDEKATPPDQAEQTAPDIIQGRTIQDNGTTTDTAPPTTPHTQTPDSPQPRPQS
jgi:sec-independent protein translocase protein TatA